MSDCTMTHSAITNVAEARPPWRGETGMPVPCLPGFRAVTFEAREDIDFATVNPFLLEYTATQGAVFKRESGMDVDATAHIQAFWENIAKVLPPQGRFYLVWSDAGELVGTGSLRRAGETTCEMKQLYVRPSTRGSGLGRWLVEQRLRDARALGITEVLADRLKGNVEMPALYAKLGFTQIPPNPNSASVGVMPFLVKHSRFFRKTL